MNATPTGVTKAANLSLFMVNVSYYLQAHMRPRDPDYSILDLKADWRGSKYVEETRKRLPEKPEPVLCWADSIVAWLPGTSGAGHHTIISVPLRNNFPHTAFLVALPRGTLVNPSYPGAGAQVARRRARHVGGAAGRTA
jgi:hypothetical protein